MYVLGPHHAIFFFFKMAKYFQVTTTPVPLDFDGLPYPCVEDTPDFFHQNDRKGCKRDYLDSGGHFVLRFGAIGDKSVVTTPPPRR